MILMLLCAMLHAHARLLFGDYKYISMLPIILHENAILKRKGFPAIAFSETTSIPMLPRKAALFVCFAPNPSTHPQNGKPVAQVGMVLITLVMKGTRNKSLRNKTH